MLVFLVAALIQFDVRLIARVPIGELLAFGAIPFLWSGLDVSRFVRPAWPIMAVLALWTFGIFLSDFLNVYIFERFIRGIMKPIFCFLWMCFFSAIALRDIRALALYPLGMVVASVQNYIAPQSFTEEYLASGGYLAVAFGISPIVVSLALLMAVFVYRWSRLLSSVPFICAGVFIVYLSGTRGSIAIQLLNAVVMVLLAWVHSNPRHRFRLSIWRIAALMTFGILTILCLYYGYVYAALNGILGEAQYTKIVEQRQTIFGLNPIGLFLGGRTEVFAAILAIIDKPIAGHGSWTGHLMSNYYFDALTLVGTNSHHIDVILRGHLSGGGAGHSVFFQGWMENGILSAISLGCILYWAFRRTIALVQIDHPLAPLYVSFATSLAWTFLSAPFGVNTRIAIGLFLALQLVDFSRVSGLRVPDYSR